MSIFPVATWWKKLSIFCWCIDSSEWIWFSHYIFDGGHVPAANRKKLQKKMGEKLSFIHSQYVPSFMFFLILSLETQNEDKNQNQINTNCFSMPISKSSKSRKAGPWNLDKVELLRLYVELFSGDLKIICELIQTIGDLPKGALFQRLTSKDTDGIFCR